jgi:hypothetical protein
MMSDKQMGVLYFVMGIVFLGFFVAVEDMLNKPTTAEQYADQLCKELYGPQVGATWEKGTLMCESARGEIIEVRRIK